LPIPVVHIPDVPARDESVEHVGVLAGELLDRAPIFGLEHQDADRLAVGAGAGQLQLVALVGRACVREVGRAERDTAFEVLSGT
jgi:hypothetical protein